MGDATEHQSNQGDRNGEHRERRTDPADRGPGAHSGREAQPRHAVVPGTASAAEGYSGGGTVEGEPLKGVEARDTGADDTGEEREREVGAGEESHGRKTQGD